MGHCTVCLLYTHFQAGEFIDIHLVFSDKLLLRSYKRLTLSLPRVTLDFDYMKILLCLMPDDFTRQRETLWEWKG